MTTILENKNNRGKKPKSYNILEINKRYLEQFQKLKYPDIETDEKKRISFYQYKCTISNFLETLNKDAAMTKREDIDAFLSNANNSKNKAAHLKSFFTFLITENIMNCRAKMGRDLLVKIIEM